MTGLKEGPPLFPTPLPRLRVVTRRQPLTVRLRYRPYRGVVLMTPATGPAQPRTCQQLVICGRHKKAGKEQHDCAWGAMHGRYVTLVMLHTK